MMLFPTFLPDRALGENATLALRPRTTVALRPPVVTVLVRCEKLLVLSSSGSPTEMAISGACLQSRLPTVIRQLPLTAFVRMVSTIVMTFTSTDRLASMDCNGVSCRLPTNRWSTESVLGYGACDAVGGGETTATGDE